MGKRRKDTTSGAGRRGASGRVSLRKEGNRLMVLESKHTTVSYRCPHCGTAVMSGVNMFSLTADMLKLKCQCGHSEMVLLNGRDDKIRLTVPCMLCPKPHRFTMKKSLFFDKDLFCLPCPYSDINICCVGEENRVKAEMSRSELELLKLLEDNGLTDFRTLHEDVPDDGVFPTDPQVREIVMFVLRELDEEGKIRCRCGADVTDRHYDVDIEDDGIRVTCSKCGAGRWIPTDSGLAAHAFLNCDSLDLTQGE